MSDTKISEPAPNWCRTCGRRPNDPMAALCLDTHHHTLERLHPQPAELAEQQGDARSLAEHITDHLCHHEYDIGGRSELLACVADALAPTGKQQVGEVQGDALVDTARRNIRQFISKASFSSSVDKQAALSCVDVLEEALAVRQPLLKASAILTHHSSTLLPKVELTDHGMRLGVGRHELYSARQPGAME